MTYTPETAAGAIAAGDTTIHAIAAATGWPIVEGCLVPDPNTWHADDGNAEITGAFESASDAARDYVDAGEWGEVESTIWINVRAWREAIDEDGDICEIDSERHKIAIDPAEPECVADAHDWQSPHSIVGGLTENPGVWGSGGSVVIHEVCMRCGCEKVSDHWAQDPSDGVQGLDSVEYRPDKYADEVNACLAGQVEFSVEHALAAGRSLIVARVLDRSAAYEVHDPEQFGDGYSDGYTDEDDEWPGPENGFWPDPPAGLIEEALDLAAAWEGVTPETA